MFAEGVPDVRQAYAARGVALQRHPQAPLEDVKVADGAAEQRGEDLVQRLARLRSAKQPQRQQPAGFDELPEVAGRSVASVWRARPSVVGGFLRPWPGKYHGSPTRLRGLLVPVLFAFQSLVAGEHCPAPIDVEARVRSLLHLAPERELSEGFAVERHESGLFVELRLADSTLIGQRTLPVEGGCDDLAQAAAVVLSAWLSDVHPDFATALPAAALAPARSVNSGLPPPLPAAIPVVPQPRHVSRAPPTHRGRLELGLGLGTELSGDNFAAAGYAVAGYWPALQGWGASAFVDAAWPRQEPLGPGLVTWRRWPAGLGPSWRVVTGSLAWDVSAGPVVGWLHFAGSKFDHSSGQNGVAWGGFLNLRVANRRGQAGLFGLVSGQFFPANAAAHASGADTDWLAPVPHFSLGLALGAWLSP